jgi:hypothetical protein
MTQHPRHQSPSTPPGNVTFDHDLSFAPARRERSFFQRRRNPFSLSIPFNFPSAMPEEIQHRQSAQRSPSTPPGNGRFEHDLSFAPARSFTHSRNPLNIAIPLNFSPEENQNRQPAQRSPSTPPGNGFNVKDLSFAPTRRERSFTHSRNPLNIAIPINFSPDENQNRQSAQQSPSTPPRLQIFQELPLRPARRSRISSERNRSQVAIPFNIPPASPQEIRLQRFRQLQGMRANDEEEDEGDFADPLEDRILNEINERTEGRQKHAERLKRAQKIRQAGGFLNMRENVKIRHKKAPTYFEQYNRNKLDRLIDFAAVAGAVKKASRPRNLVFPSSPEMREQVRNQLALRQIQKLKREAGERPQENNFLIPLKENLEADEADNEENSMLGKELKMSIQTLCQSYQRMSQRGLRSDFIFNNLKQSLENIFDNIYLIRTRYRKGNS